MEMEKSTQIDTFYVVSFEQEDTNLGQLSKERLEMTQLKYIV